MNLGRLTVTTTNGEPFTGQQSADLAYLVWLRFGRNDDSALAAWHRLLENNADHSSFQELVKAGQERVLHHSTK